MREHVGGHRQRVVAGRRHPDEVQEAVRVRRAALRVVDQALDWAVWGHATFHGDPRADTAIFTGWCSAQGLASLPATADTLAAFVDAVAVTRAPATVRRYIASIAHMHRAAELPNPAEHGAVRLARSKPTVQVQAAGPTRNLMDRMLEVDATGPRDMRNRALLDVAYDSLCWRSELVVLDMSDVEIGGDGAGTVIVRRSKTDQEGAGQVRYLAPDTVRLLQAWLSTRGLEPGRYFVLLARPARSADHFTRAKSRGCSKK